MTASLSAIGYRRCLRTRLPEIAHHYHCGSAFLLWFSAVITRTGADENKTLSKEEQLLRRARQPPALTGPASGERRRQRRCPLDRRKPRRRWRGSRRWRTAYIPVLHINGVCSSSFSYTGDGAYLHAASNLGHPIYGSIRRPVLYRLLRSGAASRHKTDVEAAGDGTGQCTEVYPIRKYTN